MDGIDQPVRLMAGDCVLLPRGKAFHFASDVEAEPTDIFSVISTVPSGGMVSINGGGDCSGVGGYFAFLGGDADLLLGTLPPIVHIRKDVDRAALRWFTERMMEELRRPQLGGSLIAEHLAQTLLIQALRLHVAERPSAGTGWLFALGDPQMNAAIGAMHAQPGRSWTLQALAEVAGMSRSSFAMKFKATVGEPAMEYLARWRMLIAADRLTNENSPISVVAHSLGYQSESAFGVAFKRIVGHSPKRFAKETRPERRTGGSI